VKASIIPGNPRFGIAAQPGFRQKPGFFMRKLNYKPFLCCIWRVFCRVCGSPFSIIVAPTGSDNFAKDNQTCHEIRVLIEGAIGPP